MVLFDFSHGWCLGEYCRGVYTVENTAGVYIVENTAGVYIVENTSHPGVVGPDISQISPGYLSDRYGSGRRPWPRHGSRPGG
jgi:hypothetical protein